MEPDKLEKENLPQVSIMPEDTSAVTLNTNDLKQKTVLFENNDITCDFEDIGKRQNQLFLSYVCTIPAYL